MHRRALVSGLGPLLAKSLLLFCVVVEFASVTAACATKPAAAPAAPPPAEAPRAAKLVNATVLANDCQGLGKNKAQLAERTMNDLVEGCTSVPGGTASFEATLLPSGRIEIAAAPGGPNVVPICVLKHALTHKVPLTKPCRLDVRMQEQQAPLLPGPSGPP